MVLLVNNLVNFADYIFICTLWVIEVLFFSRSSQIDFPDAAAMKSASNARAVVTSSHIELLLNDGQAPERIMRRMNSDSVIEQVPS